MASVAWPRATVTAGVRRSGTNRARRAAVGGLRALIRGGGRQTSRRDGVLKSGRSAASARRRRGGEAEGAALIGDGDQPVVGGDQVDHVAVHQRPAASGDRFQWQLHRGDDCLTPTYSRSAGRKKAVPGHDRPMARVRIVARLKRLLQIVVGERRSSQNAAMPSAVGNSRSRRPRRRPGRRSAVCRRRL